MNNIINGFIILEAKMNSKNILEINIIDQGKGLSLENLQLIFKNLFSNQFLGKGYLFCIKNIANELNFKLHLDSITDKGNIYGIELNLNFSENDDISTFSKECINLINQKRIVDNKNISLKPTEKISKIINEFSDNHNNYFHNQNLLLTQINFEDYVSFYLKEEMKK